MAIGSCVSVLKLGIARSDLWAALLAYSVLQVGVKAALVHAVGFFLDELLRHAHADS
jgi:hypothetical protein